MQIVHNVVYTLHLAQFYTQVMHILPEGILSIGQEE
jgi:hypothetical protein